MEKNQSANRFRKCHCYFTGTDPNDKRIFMIGGHLDSRVSDVMNAKDFAPGANDDGSGVGAVIESARILSQSKFPATIVFVAFSGEEQGLLGAKMLAEKAKNENWQLEALLNNDMIGNNLTSETNLINANQLRVFLKVYRNLIWIKKHKELEI
jgi:Zn-dependent M28 family amino/carboxypeptidase